MGAKWTKLTYSSFNTRLTQLASRTHRRKVLITWMTVANSRVKAQLLFNKSCFRQVKLIQAKRSGFPSKTHRNLSKAQ
jgi:hypothetical protein